jgi:hypothetical protein
MNVPGLDNRQMALNIMHWLSGILQPRLRNGSPCRDDRQCGPCDASSSRIPLT